VKDFDNASSNRIFQASGSGLRHCAIPKNLHNLKPLRLSSVEDVASSTQRSNQRHQVLAIKDNVQE